MDLSLYKNPFQKSYATTSSDLPLESFYSMYGFFET